MDLDELYDELKNSKLGVVCKKDNPVLQTLSKKAEFGETIGVTLKDNLVGIQIAKVMYSSNNDFDYAKERNNALYACFRIWDKRGYNIHNAKRPYGSRSFMNLIDEMGWTEADYVIFAM